MSFGEGSSSCGFFCAARKRRFAGVASAASRAWIEDSRPTTKGAIMCGNTTMSRSGTSGSGSGGRVGFSGRMDFRSFRAPGNARRGLDTMRVRLAGLAKDRDGVRAVLDDVFRDDALL